MCITITNIFVINSIPWLLFGVWSIFFCDKQWSRLKKDRVENPIFILEALGHFIVTVLIKCCFTCIYSEVASGSVAARPSPLTPAFYTLALLGECSKRNLRWCVRVSTRGRIWLLFTCTSSLYKILRTLQV